MKYKIIAHIFLVLILNSIGVSTVLEEFSKISAIKLHAVLNSHLLK